MAAQTKKHGTERGATVADEIQCAALDGVTPQGNTPNSDTVAAMLETRSMMKARFATAGELFDALDSRASANPNNIR